MNTFTDVVRILERIAGQTESAASSDVKVAEIRRILIDVGVVAVDPTPVESTPTGPVITSPVRLTHDPDIVPPAKGTQ